MIEYGLPFYLYYTIGPHSFPVLSATYSSWFRRRHARSLEAQYAASSARTSYAVAAAAGLPPTLTNHTTLRFTLLKLNSTTRTRHGRDTDRTRTKSAHVVGYELNSSIRTRPDPHGPNGVSPQKKSVRVRAGPVGSGRVRVGSVLWNLALKRH